MSVIATERHAGAHAASGIGRQFSGQLKRDLLIAVRAPGELANPLVFFLIGIALFPLGVGPGPNTLALIAAGVLWVLALFSILLAMDGLFRRDYEDGTLEQMVLHMDPLFLGVLSKIAAHWLVTGLPLAIIAPAAAVLLYLPAGSVWVLVVTLLLGTPVLSLLGAIGAALTVGLRRGGLLLALMILPLYVPVLILGAGAVSAITDGLDPAAQIKWLAVILGLAMTLAPFAASSGLRIGIEQ
jgi:heme exporter protein B